MYLFINSLFDNFTCSDVGIFVDDIVDVVDVVDNVFVLLFVLTKDFFFF